MAEMATYSSENNLSGCGFIGGIFRHRNNFPKKPPIPTLPTTNTNTLLSKPPPKPSNVARISTTSSSSSGQTIAPKTRDLTKYKPQSNDGKTLVRSTSSNVLLMSHLGNLKQQKNGNFIASNSPNATIKTIMGNIVKTPDGDFRQIRDPEELKSRGNEAYRQGKFDEALAFYDRAIVLDCKNAVYRSNKSAALIGLGRILDAVFECKIAIKIDPGYYRAHYRLATLFFRLGEAEKAVYHYKNSGPNVDSKDMLKAQSLYKVLKNCNEAWKLKEWKNLVKETQSAISLGADSAPQVYALQAEALMKLHRHEDAYATYKKGPNFSIDSRTKVLGLAAVIYQLVVEAQLCLVAGRFEHAIAKAQHTARLDPTNKEVSALVKRTQAIASLRLSGNLLFKASKFSEACGLYNEGLEHDPYNSILLCNRAACRSKLGQYEKAIEDCTIALNVRPSYSKAKLRRADCNAKMERWEASIRDYEILIRETPKDEEIARALFEAQMGLKKQKGQDMKTLQEFFIKKKRDSKQNQRLN